MPRRAPREVQKKSRAKQQLGEQAELMRFARQCVTTDLLLGVAEVPLRAGATTTLGSRPDTAPLSAHSSHVSAAAIVSSRTCDDPSSALTALLERHDRECPHCTTTTFHTKTVFGEGDPRASLMFVGEAPGETEDQLGRPFVGKAGQKLDEMIAAIGFKREDVYIANVLKSRPPNNRAPLQHEVDACGPYLAEQIRIIQPTVIVTLGGPATKLILRTELGITRLRGIWGEYRDADIAIAVMPTWHPAYVLRNYTQETRREVWSDLQAVLARLRA